MRALPLGDHRKPVNLGRLAKQLFRMRHKLRARFSIQMRIAGRLIIESVEDAMDVVLTFDFRSKLGQRARFNFC